MKAHSQQQDRKGGFGFTFKKYSCLSWNFPLKAYLLFLKISAASESLGQVLIVSIPEPSPWLNESMSLETGHKNLFLLTNTSDDSNAYWNLKAADLYLVFTQGFCQMDTMQKN